jgi:hypothetical protein
MEVDDLVEHEKAILIPTEEELYASKHARCVLEELERSSSRTW